MVVTDAGWEPLAKLRDDDPYSAWAYHDAVERGDEDDPLCALVAELPFEEDRDAQIERIERLFDALREGGDLTASEPEIAHLGRSAEAVRSGAPPEEAWTAEATRYLRLYLLYAPERVIFAPEDEEHGGRRTSRWDDLFEIRYVGRPVRSRATRTGPLRRSDLLQEPRDSDLVIIDDSIAFANAAFVRPSGGTVFDNLWFQALERPGRGTAIGGTRLEPDDVNALLADIADPQSDRSETSTYLGEVTATRLGMTFRPVDMASPVHQPLAHGVSHGTHVAATALAAFERAGGDPARLGFSAITIPVEVTEDTSGASLGAYFLAAVRQAMLWNDARAVPGAGMAPPPLVISCSYGYLAGLKDGTDPLSRVVADLLEGRNALGRATALVLPMGNSFEARGVAHQSIPPGGEMTFDLIVQPDDRTPSFLDLFATDPDGAAPELEIEVAPPHDLPNLLVRAGDLGPGRRLVLLGGAGRLAEWSTWTLPQGSDFHFRGTLGLAPTTDLARPRRTVPHGRWRVAVRNLSAEREADLWAFVQRDDTPGTFPRSGRQAYLQTPRSHAQDVGHYHARLNYDALEPGDVVVEARCVSVLACIDSPHVYVAGAGEGAFGDADGEIPIRASRYASAGPRDGDVPGVLGTVVDGPDITALSDRSVEFPGIFAAATLSGGGVAVSGASVAAPQVAGYLAANPRRIAGAKRELTLQPIPNPAGAARRDARFGTALRGGVLEDAGRI